jgi:hypothetical protein
MVGPDTAGHLAITSLPKASLLRRPSISRDKDLVEVYTIGKDVTISVTSVPRHIAPPSRSIISTPISTLIPLMIYRLDFHGPD